MALQFYYLHGSAYFMSNIVEEIYRDKFRDLPIMEMAIYIRQNFGIYNCKIGRCAEELFELGEYKKYCNLMVLIMPRDSVKARLIREKLQK
jgi:hypothetical protein